MDMRFVVGEVDAYYNIFKRMRIEGHRRYTLFWYFPRKWAPNGNRDDKVRSVRSAVAREPDTDRPSPV